MSGTWLMLDIEHQDIAEARKFVYGFKAGSYTVKRVKVKRSLNANALCWKLCQEIGDAIGEPALYVYKRAISEGNVFAYMEMPSGAVERFTRDWSSRGDGWVVQVIDTYGHRTSLRAYYGSSTYDTKEMSDLIERLLQDADSLGINCLSERERSLLESL